MSRLSAGDIVVGDPRESLADVEQSLPKLGVRSRLSQVPSCFLKQCPDFVRADISLSEKQRHRTRRKRSGGGGPGEKLGPSPGAGAENVHTGRG